MTMTYKQWIAMHDSLMAREKAYRVRLDARLRVLARKAGIDSGDCMYTHLHNCQVPSTNGQRKMWANVDYTVIHQMQALCDKMWAMNALIDKWSAWAWREIVNE